MQILVSTLLFVVVLTGCATSENQIQETIKKNPKLVFDVIEENPEQFIEVVNRAAQAAQQKRYEKQLSEAQNQQVEDLKNPKKPKLSNERRLIGTDAGKIILVSYSDFQCPACRMGHASLKEFQQKYKGQVQFYHKNMPLDFHPMAMPASLYYEAIFLQDKTKAAKFYDSLFENQRQLSEAFLKKTATALKVDMKRLEADMKSEKVRKIIEEDMSEFENFRFTGTPVLLVNGIALGGAQRLEDIEKVVQLTTK